jgi:hypothetical protein
MTFPAPMPPLDAEPLLGRWRGVLLDSVSRGGENVLLENVLLDVELGDGEGGGVDTGDDHPEPHDPVLGAGSANFGVPNTEGTL